MNAPASLIELQAAKVDFKLDGRSVSAFEGETILTVAKREGIEIPHLCFKDAWSKSPESVCLRRVVAAASSRAWT